MQEPLDSLNGQAESPRKILPTVSPVRILFLGVMLGTAFLMMAALSPTLDLLGNTLKVPDQLKPADIVVAVSAGQLRHCKAHPNLFLREAYASMLMRNGYSRSGKLLISGIYTDGTRLNEAQCKARMAHLLHIAPEKLLMDNTAKTTLDNARHTQTFMTANQWQNVLLVTSHSHMKRALKVFRKQGMETYPVSIPDMPPYHNAWLDANRLSHLKRFLYEYGALLKYKWYGYI